ncbi:MAG: polysaccharide lyase [Janthinobacterium lividum]
MTHALTRTSLTLAAVVLATTALFTAPVTTRVAAAAPAPTVTSAKPQRTILSATFDSTKRGAVDAKSFNKLVGPTNTNKSAFAGMTYRKDYRGSGNVVRHKLAGGKFIASKGEGRGNVLMIKLPGSYDSACMSYDVRFAAPFDFSAGGKLPGFVGVAPGTSPSTPEGGGSTAHGWSGRLMWLGAKMWKFVRDADRTNMVVTYLYHPGQVREFGDNVSWGSSFTPGVWHHVRQCHVMNTVGEADGVLRTWFDGRLVMQETDVVYRTDPKVHITHFDWSVFRGGSSSTWAGAKNAYVDLDNLQITAG